MAHCSFTSEEKQRIDSIAHELEDTIEEFFGDARAELSCAEWELLNLYACACIRRALVVGLKLRSIAEGSCSGSPYPGRGQETFVRDALVAWRDSFAPMPNIWRLAPIFEKLQGGESRALADVAALEVMAANRMFTSLDEQYQAFLAGE